MKNNKPFFVFDANTLISSQLVKNSVSAKALDKALNFGMLAVSSSTLNEFTEVIFREKLKKYFRGNERQDAVDYFTAESKKFATHISITACRDPKDDKYLELALTCKAACIVSGDKDLLVLHPFRNIPILTAAEFLKTF